MKEISIEDNPEVSIVVPMYNAERWVATTINSLLTQTYSNIEIIIVDDGSTDNSKRIVDHFSFDRRIRYFYKENGGTGSALNMGHENARGKYVTWCSADNVYYPHFIETLRAALEQMEAEEQNVQLIYSDFYFINERGQPVQTITHENPQSLEDLICGYDIGMSFLYTKELWNKTGPYWSRICEDYNWCVRAAQHTEFGLVKATLAGFRLHSGQITGSRKAEEKAAADDCKALASLLWKQTSENCSINSNS